MWHLSFPAMRIQLKLFKEGGITLSEENLTCMSCCENVLTKVLSLPPEIDG